MDPIRLLNTLLTHFDSAELATLCFRVGIKWDDLRGDARPEKARELVTWAQRQSLVDALVRAILEMKGDNPRVRESLFGEGGEEANKPAPYVGLTTFTEAEARYFFGRAALVAALTQRLRAAPFLAVLGPSGSGKSSVVLAGLLPALRNGALPGSERWRYATLKPGARPLDALAATLATVQGGDVERARRLRPMLAADEQALLTLADMLRAGNADTRLVLVVDQFEELWTQAPTEPDKQRAFAESERLPFLRLLLAGTTGLSEEARARSPLLVILTLRADFLHRAAEVPELARAIQDHLALVSPMSREELREAIEAPARLAGVAVEPGLVPEMLDAVAAEPGALPLLQYTLLELWKLRAGGTLTRTAYDALGGVAGALAARAEALLAQHYAGEKRDDLRHLLLRLVQPGEGAADTRRRALLREVVPAGSIATDVQTLLQPLVDERLLTTGRDAATGAETIDLSHESLIRAWPTLRGWIDEGRDDLRLHRQLEGDAREWQRHTEDTDLLWSALRVANAEAWQARARPALSTPEARFLAASRAHVEALRRDREALLEARAQAEQRSRIEAERRAEIEARAAAEAEAAAHHAQALAYAGEALFEVAQGKINRAMGLALAATLEARAQDSYPPLVTRALHETLLNSPLRILRGHSAGILAAAWSPDGQKVITGSADTTARLWDIGQGNLLHTLGEHPDEVRAVAWSPDGKKVATGSTGVQFWDAMTGQFIGVLGENRANVYTIAWSPDGKQLVTGHADEDIAELWDIASGQLTHVFEGDANGVLAVEWSPDGQEVMIGSDNGAIRWWQVFSGQSIRMIWTDENADMSYAEWVYAMAWDPTGKWLVKATRRGTDLLFLKSHEAKFVATLGGDTQAAKTVAWSSEVEQGAIGCMGGVAYLLDLGGIELTRRFSGHTGDVNAIAWSPDGKHLITGSKDATARLWDVGGADGTARLWIASDRLVAAALIRRTCRSFTDEEIRATVPSWQGNCADLLEEARADADEYERLLGLDD